MMQTTNILGLTQIVLNDIQRIEYCLRSSGCIYRLENLPFQNTADRSGQQSTSLVLVQYDTYHKPDRLTLLGLSSTNTTGFDILNQPCSFTRVLGSQKHDFPFIFELIEPPLFEPLPVLVGAAMGVQYRWAVHAKLSGKCGPTYGVKDFKQSSLIHLTLELLIPTCQTPASWFTSVSTLNPSVFEKSQQTILLSTLTTSDLLSEALSNPSLTMNLQLNVTLGSVCYTLMLEPPCNISFPTLMTQLNKSHRIKNKTLPVISLLPWFYTHRMKWRISAVVNDEGLDRSPTALLRVLSVLFESKLGLADTSVIRGMDNSWGLITLGPLTGMAVRFQLVDPDSCAISLEAISSQNTQLDFLERAILDCAPHIRLDRVQPTATRIHETPSKPTGLHQVIDSLLSEIDCLTDLISRLVERTMRNRVPHIGEFLSTLDGHLELAHRASDWHAKASVAHMEPVGQTYGNAEFVSCLRSTEAVLSRLMKREVEL